MCLVAKNKFILKIILMYVLNHITKILTKTSIMCLVIKAEQKK